MQKEQLGYTMECTRNEDTKKSEEHHFFREQVIFRIQVPTFLFWGLILWEYRAKLTQYEGALENHWLTLLNIFTTIL